MGWLNQLTPKSAPSATQMAERGAASLRPLNGKREVTAPDATSLRDWRGSIPLLFRGVRKRRTQIVNSPWHVAPLDPDKGYSTQAIDEITTLLRSPNPGSTNNSFPGTFGPMVDDVMVLDLGVLQKLLKKGGKPYALRPLDGGRLEIDSEWTGDPTIPRYFYRDDDQGEEYTPFLNSELITITLNSTTYSQRGMSPIHVLYRTLQGYVEVTQRIQLSQKHGGPSSLINVAGAGQENLKSIARRFQMQVEPNSNVVWTDFDVSDLKIAELTTVDLIKLGSFEYHKILVREIAAALDMSPIELMQEEDTHRSSAQTQHDITLDDGVRAPMRDIAGYINREIVSHWNDPNIAFIWDDLMGPDEAETAENIRTRSGVGVNWMTINEMRVYDGLEPITASSEEEDHRLNKPLILQGHSSWVPTTDDRSLPPHVPTPTEEDTSPPAPGPQPQPIPEEPIRTPSKAMPPKRAIPPRRKP